MRLTKSAIIEASKMPISIIIGKQSILRVTDNKFTYLFCSTIMTVGIGNDDFEAMNELDSDDIKLTDGENFAERDIVQFVPLNNFLSKDGSYVKFQADLAEEVLAEIPDQLTNYMIWRGFQPKPDIDSSATGPNIASVASKPEN